MPHAQVTVSKSCPHIYHIKSSFGVHRDMGWFIRSLWPDWSVSMCTKTRPIDPF